MAQLSSRLLLLSKKLIGGKQLFRNLTTTKYTYKNYEGDGKTTVAILNREYKHLVLIDSVSNYGFRLNNNIFVVGPLAVFPRTILQWNVNDIESLTPESLSLFCLLEPKLDIFILGTGEKRILPKREIVELFKEKKINLEVLDTEKACSTFNFLNVEARCVAAAFLPPVHIEVYDEEIKLIDETSGRMGEGGVIM